MSSPNMNNLIILGSILVYAAVLIGGMDSNLLSETIEAIFCQVTRTNIIRSYTAKTDYKLNTFMHHVSKRCLKAKHVLGI